MANTFLIDSNMSEYPQTKFRDKEELFITLGRILLRRTWLGCPYFRAVQVASASFLHVTTTQHLAEGTQ
jgi:hypothetical protein